MNFDRDTVVIIVDQLNLHSAPGGDDTKLGRVVRKGERYCLLDRRTMIDGTGLRVDWAKIQVGNGTPWIAEKNFRTGEVFVRIEAAPPLPPPRYDPPKAPGANWKCCALRLGLLGGAIAIVLLVVYGLVSLFT